VVAQRTNKILYITSYNEQSDGDFFFTGRKNNALMFYR